MWFMFEKSQTLCKTQSVVASVGWFFYSLSTVAMRFVSVSVLLLVRPRLVLGSGATTTMMTSISGGGGGRMTGWARRVALDGVWLDGCASATQRSFGFDVVVVFGWV